MERERYIIDGGRKLEGVMEVHGAKNAALPILAASLLCDRCRLYNCPHLSDVEAACHILEHLGCRVRWEGEALEVETGSSLCGEIPDPLMREMRSSIVFLGAILARCRRARLSFPGGCELGPRPIDLHLDGLRRLGAVIREEGGCLECETPDGLHGAAITLPFPSVGATENIMLAACAAQGETILYNAAREPEIADLAGFLNTCGGQVELGADGTIRIQGGRSFPGGSYRVIPDRIVTVTYLCGCAAAGGEIQLEGARPQQLRAVIPILEQMGCRLECRGSTIRMQRTGPLRAGGNITTMPYPGFPTDALAPVMAVAASAQGTTVFVENIFQNRFKQAEELARMGADIRTEGRIAVVRGVPQLSGAQVRCTDLRGGAALVVAALSAKGRTEVQEIRHILRGYENLDRAFARVGASIRLA